MRALTLYQPGEVPGDPAQMARFLREELAKVQAALALLAAGHLERQYALPPKPRDGDLRYLDATIAPGGVTGIYYHNGTTWVQL